MQAVILAGGKGTRLASRLNGRPKPLVSVCGVPLLERQLTQLAQQGVTQAVVLVNHQAEQIRSFLSSRVFPLEIIVIDDGEPRGTAGAVIGCADLLAERFLVIYGDTLFDIDIGAMLRIHEQTEAQATLLLHPNDHPADSDLVEVDDDGRILGFHAYPHPLDEALPNLVNAAFYVVERSLIEAHTALATPADFAKDLFPSAVRDGSRIQGYRSLEYIKDLGTPARLDKVERHLMSGVVARARRAEPQSAVFVDRDGTLNWLRDYVRNAEEFELLPGVAESMRRLNAAEWRVVVITNQPVLARGECSFAEMRRIHAKMDSELGRHGAYVDGLYLCPHHPDGGFPGEVSTLKVVCDCRKPKAGLIERAIADMNINRSTSFFIGDSWRDMAAARNAGITSVLVQTGEAHDARCDDAGFVVEDFTAAVDLILHHARSAEASSVKKTRQG